MASDQLDYRGSAMIALYPPSDVVDQLVLPGGEDPAELHCTVAYLGDASDVDLKTVLGVAATVARRAPVEGSIAGHARFTGGETDVQVALVDSPQLEQLRRDLVDALTTTGIEIPRDHGYTAHITQLYVDPAEPSPVDRIDPIPVTFAALSVVHGERRIDIPFGDPAAEAIAPYARTSYAQGWAASGGPMTERVKAGCAAAVALAVEKAHDPAILEATLRLGHLEGTWAAVYDRREQIYTDHIGTVATLWRHAAARVDLALAVRRYRQSLGLGETADPNDPDHRKLIAKAIAAAILAAISGDAADPGDRDALTASIADALRAGQAEGWAGALAVAADRAGATGFDFDRAYTDAYAQLGDTGWQAQSTGWLAKITTAITAALANALDNAARDGESKQDMLDAVHQSLSGEQGDDPNKTLALILDYAISLAFTAGGMALFRKYSIELTNFVTAGDERVCHLCEDAEAGNPWRIEEVSEPPLHYRCRCVLVPGADLPPDAYDQYVEGS